MYLFNKVVETSVILPEWQEGTIIPIFKNKGEISNPTIYCGITLLSCLGKLFTSVINQRLFSFVETNQMLKENQVGFRKGYSTLNYCFLLNLMIVYFVMLTGPCIVPLMIMQKRLITYGGVLYGESGSSWV